MVLPDSVPFASRWLAGMDARLRHGRHASVDQAGAGLLGHRSIAYREALSAHAGSKLLLWETTYDDLLPIRAREQGYRLIALPHNLESLVSDAVFRLNDYDPLPDLAAEIRRLRRADHVFTMSREERWLLEARGLSPGYLPFYPAGELAAECAAFRAKREQAAAPDGCLDGPLLLLGSAFNPATARGMRRQLEWLAADRTATREVVVVGPDSDRLFAGFADTRIRILGAVSREQLAGLMTACAALLVHTYGGAGAVTRIPEALLAGIPVISNPNGARDQHGTAGVHVYVTEAEFTALARASLPLPPLPPPPAAALRHFAAALRQCAPLLSHEQT